MSSPQDKKLRNYNPDDVDDIKDYYRNAEPVIISHNGEELMLTEPQYRDWINSMRAMDKFNRDNMEEDDND